MSIDELALKVGDIGEQIVKDYFSHIPNVTIQPAPDKRVDVIINGDYVEITTNNQVRFGNENVPVFYIKVNKIERIFSFADDYGVDSANNLVIVIVDKISKCIYKQTLGNLFFKKVVDGITFPIKSERILDKDTPAQEVFYFPVIFFKKITPISSPQLLDKLNAAYEELYKAKGFTDYVVPTDGTLFEEKPIDETIKSELEIVKARPGHQVFLLTPFSQCKLKFAQIRANKWVLNATSLQSVISDNPKSTFTFKDSKTLPNAVKQVCKMVFDSSSEKSTVQSIWLQVEDIESVLANSLRYWRKALLKERAPKILAFWRETIIPHIQNGTIEQIFQAAAKEQPATTSTVAPQPNLQPATTSCNLEMSVVRQLRDTIIKFKGYGINGQSLPAALNCVYEETQTDLNDLVDLLMLVQPEPPIDRAKLHFF